GQALSSGTRVCCRQTRGLGRNRTRGFGPRISWFDVVFGRWPNQDRTVLAYASDRRTEARADGRYQVCEMGVVETSRRDPHARARESVPGECGSGRAQGGQAIRARELQQAVDLQ